MMGFFLCHQTHFHQGCLTNVANLDFDLEQLDVKTFFLHGDLEVQNFHVTARRFLEPEIDV